MAPSDQTAPGTELPKQYRPADHEGAVWERWVAANAFHADPSKVKPDRSNAYAIVMPPPNVTDRLHLGHALNNTLQDILARSHRMKGFETLWMPGTDHAGIATQAVVERRVMKEEKKRKSDFTREQFVAKIQAFKDEYEATITDQLKKMGCSCDWDRQAFTMDEVRAKAVREAFFRLFKDGLIYRGKRLVNWDPALQTAIADDEIENIEVDGFFYYLRYPLIEPVTLPSGETVDYVTVATTRPETYLGDTAVAINPKDPRAAALVGKQLRLPLVGRVIPIVADDYVVMRAREGEEATDPKAKFATGFLKVTPAHDPNDYEIGRRHGLDVINIMAPDAKISDRHGWSDIGEASIFVGLKREDARKKVVEEFKRLGLFEEAKPYRHTVGHSDRSKAAIEPYLSDQWYVKVTDPRLAQAANAALDPAQRSHHIPAERVGSVATTGSDGDGALEFSPPRYAKTYELWHDNIRDWCISRQLWWGHQIPVWAGTGAFASHEPDADLRLLAQWEREGRICPHPSPSQTAYSDARIKSTVDPKQAPTLEDHDSAERARPQPWQYCVSDPDDRVVTSKLEQCGYRRDPDVLDTWFSSALWPMSTMGWPDETPLLAAFNPTSTLCTAREIITLWVSRMVMFNRYFRGGDLQGDDGKGRGPVPFKDVFIHAMIQDGDGRKMSKSLGNGVDPLDIIASHGADAMRFTLCHMTTQTQDVRMPVSKDPITGKNTSPKFDLGRNFANKLWNASRFTLGILEGAAPVTGDADPARYTLADRWMLSRLAVATAEADAALAGYEFSTYAQVLYDLVWRDFCDWYLEAIKPTVADNPHQRAVLRNVLAAILRLLHPVMPFITEAIDERLRSVAAGSIPALRLAPSRSETPLLCTSGWPEFGAAVRDADAEAAFERLRGLVTVVREVRAQHNVSPRRRVTLHLPADARWVESLRAVEGMVATLAGVDRFTPDAPAGPGVSAAFDAVEFRLSDLADAVDAHAESARLEKLIADLDKSVLTFEGRLANPGYALKAPPAMVQQTQDQLAKSRAERAAAASALAALRGGG